jgi:2-methylcitrate dehydratase PrpD
LAAYEGRVEFHDILHDRRSDPRIQSLSERVEVIGDEETDKTYPDFYRSIITVETQDGKRRVRDIMHPKGSPENPVSRAALNDKFAALTAEVLDPGRARRITELVGHMEELTDIGALTQLLGCS